MKTPDPVKIIVTSVVFVLALAALLWDRSARKLAESLAPAEVPRRESMERIGSARQGDIYFFRHDGRACYLYESNEGAFTPAAGSLFCVDEKEKR